MKKHLLVLTLATSLNSLSEGASDKISLLTGVVTGALGYAATGDSSLDDSTRVLIASGAAIAGGALGKLITGKYTPSGRLSRGKDWLKSVQTSNFATLEFHSTVEIAEYAHQLHPKSSWHLVLGSNLVDWRLCDVNCAISLFETVLEEEKDDRYLINKATDLLYEAKAYRKILVRNSRLISNHPLYMGQYQIYQKHRELQLREQEINLKQQQLTMDTVNIIHKISKAGKEKKKEKKKTYKYRW